MKKSSVICFAQETGIARFLRRTVLWQLRKRIIRRPYRMKMPTGSTLILPPTTSGSAIYITQCNIDWGGEKLLALLQSPEGVFIDAGAHIGYYAMYISPLVREVWAFEPDPKILPSLHANSSQCGNITVITKAVYHSRGSMPFLVGAGGISHLASEPNGNGLRVDITTLDYEWQAAGSPLVTGIKVDVEGRDLDVLFGAENLVKACQPLVFTEMNDRSRLPELWKWLGLLEYDVWAYTRPSPGDPKVLLERFRTHDAAALRFWTMLFLVPSRLKSKFQSTAGKQS